MSTNETSSVEIDLVALEAELDALTPEQLQAELLKVRTRQKVQQKKMQGSAGHKSYQKKQQEKRKLLVAKAKALGIYDSVNEQAEKDADIILKNKGAAGVAVAEETDNEPEIEIA